MIRSLTDIQIQAKRGFDPEPWVGQYTGERSSTMLNGRFLPAPRREFIPAPDPKPYVTPGNIRHSSRSHFEIGGATFACKFKPRPWPELQALPKPPVRTEGDVNQILSAFRDEHGTAHLWLADLDYPEVAGWPLNRTPKQIADARRVLTRLRDVMGASK